MTPLIILGLFVLMVLLYILDYLTAVKNARTNWELFEKSEMNKGLVYALWKDEREPGQNTKLLHYTSLGNWVLVIFLFIFVGSFFEIKASLMTIIFLIIQSLAHAIGITSNLIAGYKIKLAQL